MKLWANILDIIYPNYCISCQEKGSRICQKCVHLIEKSKEHELRRIYSVFDYKNPFIRKILLENKYRNKHSAIEPLIPIVADELLEIFSAKFGLIHTENIYITEIPMSQKRIKKRDINHGKIIALKIAEECKKRGFNINQKSLLVKNFETTPQAQIKNKKNRLKNVVGSFSLSKNIDKKISSTIIIIDDISTTGATLIEAEKVLRKYGYKRILLLSIAH